MQRWQCPIHNGTPETFIWSIRWMILSSLEFWQCLFLTIPICNPAVYKMRKMVEILQLKINGFENDQVWYLSHTWSEIDLKGTIVNRKLVSLHESSDE